MSENLPALKQNLGPSIPTEHEMMVYNTMAKQAVASKMYRGIGEESGVMMIMLSARELGIPPMQALNGGINIIQGKAEISARMMSALIRKAGHKIKIKESTDDICVLIGERNDTGEIQEASFSVEDAKRAGLIKGGGGWVKCPKDMCFARALSRLARQLFSDVIGIGYVEGEIKSIETVPLLPEEFIPAEVAEEFVDYHHQLLSKFHSSEWLLLEEFIEAACKHFEWPKEECCQKFVEDKDIIDKFNKWKARRLAQ